MTVRLIIWMASKYYISNYFMTYTAIIIKFGLLSQSNISCMKILVTISTIKIAVIPSSTGKIIGLVGIGILRYFHETSAYATVHYTTTVGIGISCERKLVLEWFVDAIGLERKSRTKAKAGWLKCYQMHFDCICSFLWYVRRCYSTASSFR